MSPLLRNGKKFHFRCYSLLMGDLTALVYQRAFILTAGFDFDLFDADVTKHITNLSVNKKFENHPGQIPCDLAVEYPWVRRTIALLSCDDVINIISFLSLSPHEIYYEENIIVILLDNFLCYYA